MSTLDFDEKSPKRSNDTPSPDDVSSTITVIDVYEPGSIDPVYQAKAHLLSCAVQEIGMGKYQVRPMLLTSHKFLNKHVQWILFVVAGVSFTFHNS